MSRLSFYRRFKRAKGKAGNPPGKPVSGILSGLSPTGAWSMSRALVPGFGTTYYHLTSSAIDTLYDQSGSSRDFLDGGVPTRRPAVATAGPNSIACASFDGNSDFLTTGSALSNFISAGAGFVIISCVVNAAVGNSATPYLNDLLIGDQSQFMGVYLRVTPTVYGFNWDGNADTQSNSFVIGTAYVFTWRHEGGNVFLGVNGVETAGTPSGNTSTMTGSFDLCGRATQFSQTSVFEAATFSTVPSSADITRLVQNFGNYVGAAV